MGRGDIRTRKGKIWNSSFGNSRMTKKKLDRIARVAAAQAKAANAETTTGIEEKKDAEKKKTD